MEELTRLEAFRKGYKSHVTCAFNRVAKTFNQESLDELSAAHLPIAIDQLTNKLETLKQIDDRIAGLIEDPEQLEHTVFEAEDVQEEISNKIGEINAFIELQKSSKATSTDSQSPDSRMTEVQSKLNHPTARQSLNLDTQAVTTLSSLSSDTNTISVAVSPNGVITQSPTVFSGGFASGYPASSVDLGRSFSLPPQSSTTRFMSSSPSSVTDVTATNVGVSFPPHPLMLSTTNPTSVSHNTQFGMPFVNHNTSCLGLSLPTTHTTFGTPFLSTWGAYPAAAMNQTYSQA